ncbi:tail fiber domain-containing protein [Spirosoma linguale]
MSISVAQAQVKVGSNPTTISTNANLEVEATNGTKVMVQKADGRVGIGTTSPAAALDVSSTTSGILMPRLTTAQRDALVNPPASLMIWNTTDGDLQVNAGTPSVPVWVTSNNVTAYYGLRTRYGMGFATNGAGYFSSSSLNYTGLGATGYTYASSYGSAGGYVFTDGGTFALSTYLPGTGNAAYGKQNAFVVANAGNVGLGTFTPTNTLHVVGDARITGMASGSATDNIVTADANGVLRTMSFSAVAGSSTSLWSLLGNAGTNPTTNFLGTTDAQGLAFRTNNNDRMRIDANGFVGINTGSSSLSANMTVNGTTVLKNKPVWDLLAAELIPNTYLHFGQVSGGSPAGMQMFNWTRREASSSTPPSSDTGIFGRDVNTYGRSFMQYNTDGSLAFGTESAASALTNSGGNPPTRLTIDPTGNVGIGATAPTNTLHVAGTARITGMTSGTTTDNIVTADANGVLRTMSFSAVVGSGTNIYSTDGTLAANRIVGMNGKTLSFSSTNGNAVRLDNGGHITLAPSATSNSNLIFNNQDGTGTAGYITFNENNSGNNALMIRTTGTSAKDIWLNTGNAGVIRFQPGDGEVMRILPTGKVGIGTTTPSAKLAVSDSTIGTAGAAVAVTKYGNRIAGDNVYAIDLGASTVASDGTNYAGLINAFGSYHSGSGTVTRSVGLLSNVNTFGTGSMATGIGFTTKIQSFSTGGVRNAIGYYIDAVEATGTDPGNPHNAYGIYLPNAITASGGSVNSAWSIYNASTASSYYAGNVGIGTTTPNAPLQFSNSLANRKIVLYDGNNNDNMYYGFGINGGLMRYQVADQTNSHAFYSGVTSTSSTELMRITGTGRVGIGTNSPNVKLTVIGSSFMQDAVVTNPFSATFVDVSGKTDFAQSMIYDGGARAGFGVATAPGDSRSRMYLVGARDYLYAMDLVIPNGNVGIGTTVPTAKLNISGGNGNSLTGTALFKLNDTNLSTTYFGVDNGASGNAYRIISSAPTTASAVNMELQAAGNANQLVLAATSGNVGIGTSAPSQKLHVVGNILASGTITPSDARFKENVATLNGSLAKLTQLRGVSYTHKAEFIKVRGLSAGKQIGFIAQELEKTFPEFVVTSADGYKAVDYARLTPVLVESLKEVNAKLQAQDAKMTRQQAEIDALKAAVKQLMDKK